MHRRGIAIQVSSHSFWRFLSLYTFTVWRHSEWGANSRPLPGMTPQHSELALQCLDHLKLNFHYLQITPSWVLYYSSPNRLRENNILTVQYFTSSPHKPKIKNNSSYCITKIWYTVYNGKMPILKFRNKTSWRQVHGGTEKQKAHR